MAKKYDDSDNIAVIEAAEKKKDGRGGYRKNATPPQVRKGFGENPEDRALVSKLLGEALVAYRMPKVKSDEELAERFDQYFKMCAQTGQIPTVEEMVMYTGYTYAAVYDWEVGRNHGFSPETTKIVKKAKEYIKTFDAKLVISGKLNFLAYCFRAKQYYGFVEKQEIIVNTGDTNEDTMSAEDIAKRYLEDGKTIPTTFTDGVD